MKEEKDHSAKGKKNMGLATIATAFVTGAAAGLAVGILIASDKETSFRDKVRKFIREVDGDRTNEPDNQTDNQPAAQSDNQFDNQSANQVKDQPA